MNGIITEIQHASVHDGPGLRSVVFLKGCQMRCFWCHNPETISTSPQLFFDESKCMGCGRCLGFCEAHKLSNGRHRIERAFCTSCFRCVETCFTGALSVCGRVVSVDEVMRDLAEDIPFYGESGGGVTVSGGEPGCQSDFTAEILHRCHKMKIHAALETNLAYSRAILEKAPWVRLCCGHMHRPIFTQWAGVAAVTAPAASMQIDLDLSPEGGDTFVMEAPGYLLHDWRDGAWNTHVCQIYGTPTYAGPYRFLDSVNPTEE